MKKSRINLSAEKENKKSKSLTYHAVYTYFDHTKLRQSHDFLLKLKAKVVPRFWFKSYVVYQKPSLVMKSQGDQFDCGLDVEMTPDSEKKK